VRSVSYGRTEKEAQALLNAFGELIYYLSSPITFSPRPFLRAIRPKPLSAASFSTAASWDHDPNSNILGPFAVESHD
jgi:hypothetical protein